MSAPAAVRQIIPEEATAFLGHDPIGNVELLTAICYDREVRCIGALHDGTLAGVLIVAREEDDNALAARFEAVEGEMLSALIAACPPGVRRIAVHRPWTLPALKAAFRLVPDQPGETVFFAHTIAPPPASPAARLLTEADAPLMERGATMVGGSGFLRLLAQGFRAFGVVTDGRVVAHAFAGSATEWTEEVMSVWTAPRRRGEGLATAVVAVAAADILSRGKTALYVAAVTNRASQRVAVKVGFEPSYDTTSYRVLRQSD